MQRWAVPWLPLAALYLLFAGQASTGEMAVAATGGALLALFGVAIRRAAHRHFTFAAPWPRLVLKPLITLLRDIPRVGQALLRAAILGDVTGGMARQAFREGARTGPDAARRALVTLAGSFAPNAYVVAVEPGALVIHRLLPERPKPDAEWPL